jgi:hypothetical protein
VLWDRFSPSTYRFMARSRHYDVPILSHQSRHEMRFHTG